MTSLTSNVSYIHAYSKNSAVNFIHNDKDELTVTIDTKRLHMRSVQESEKDYDSYAALYGDPEVMEKFATGVTRTREEVIARIKIWSKRWLANDPYSSLAIFSKKTNKFLGHIVLGYGEMPGESEIAYLLKKKSWEKKYGTEAALAVVYEYAPALIKKGYLMKNNPLKTITATGRVDNPASIEILRKKLNMKEKGLINKYEGTRHSFFINVEELNMDIFAQQIDILSRQIEDLAKKKEEKNKNNKNM